MKFKSILIGFGVLSTFSFYAVVKSVPTLNSAVTKAIHNPKKLIKAAINCKYQIDSVKWREVEYSNKFFEAAVITPSECGRMGLNPNAAWDEFLTLVPDNKLWSDRSADNEITQSMKNQFFCHWVNPKAQQERLVYKIEPQRRLGSLLETYHAGCNIED